MNERALLREAIAWCKERHGENIGTALSYSVRDGTLTVVLQAGYKEQFSVPDLQARIDAHRPPDATAQARALARKKNVDLRTVQGTGLGGRIVVADVRRYS